jgi:hypothetical protein
VLEVQQQSAFVAAESLELGCCPRVSGNRSITHCWELPGSECDVKVGELRVELEEDEVVKFESLSSFSLLTGSATVGVVAAKEVGVMVGKQAVYSGALALEGTDTLTVVSAELKCCELAVVVVGETIANA